MLPAASLAWLPVTLPATSFTAPLTSCFMPSVRFLSMMQSSSGSASFAAGSIYAVTALQTREANVRRCSLSRRRRIIRSLQNLCKVRRVRRQRRNRAGNLVGRLLQVDVIGVAHGFAHPIGGTPGGNGETDIGQCLVQLCGDVVGAIFVAHHADDGDLAEG